VLRAAPVGSWAEPHADNIESDAYQPLNLASSKNIIILRLRCEHGINVPIDCSVLSVL